MMERNRILLALKDEEEIKAFTGHLSGLGFEMSIARDGARALELSLQEVPALVIADLDLSIISAERIFQILRKNPHTSAVPFLFVSDAIADIKGFRAGIDIFLLRPLNLEEMHSRIRQTLSVKEGVSWGKKEIEGRLSHMSLADILQFLHLNKKEGELRVASGEQTGTVYVKDGLIYNASIGHIEKEKALFRMLELKDGKFEFMPGSVTAPKKIKTSTGNLLMEGMRQIDELKNKEDQLPDRRLSLKSKVKGELPKGLQPVIYEIMQLVKRHTKVEEIIERSTYPDYEVYRTIASMLARGILEEDRENGKVRDDDEFLTPDQSISIREKIISRFSDMINFNYGRILLLSTSGELAASFLKQCSHISSYTPLEKGFSPAIADSPLGDVGSLRLHGGMELVLFSLPVVKRMGPLWKAFSTNLVGLVLLWDESGEKEFKELLAAKKDILSKRRVPVVHVFSGEEKDAEALYRKALSLRPEEPLLRLTAGDKGMAGEVFYSLFGKLIKEDYITA